ncbi:hypothetical protein GCM10025857_23730 [Alicyclobacillus contaminans]|nr:hypothetical protein GCM10025857_23730 [Alicyclobacillus contaminans]
MMWLETVRVAWRSIRANKMRSFLTMLGIIIGVMAVIGSSAVGVAAKNSVTKQVEGLGSNVITVMPGAVTSGGINRGFGSASTLKYEDVSAILQQDPDVAMAAPLVSHNSQVVFESNNTSTAIEGTTPDYMNIHNMAIAEGRFFQQPEVDHSANVAVLGSSAAQTLFAGTGVNPIGQTITIDQIPFTVIGVAAPKDPTDFRIWTTLSPFQSQRK